MRSCASSSASRANSTRAGSSEGDPRIHLRLRALRLLPADLPDVPPLARGDGLAARTHPPHGRAPGRDDRAEPDRHATLRPLPWLHGLPVLLPLGRPLRPTDRGNPRRGRAGRGAIARRSLRARSALSPSPVSGADARGSAPRAAGSARAGAKTLPPAHGDRSSLARRGRRSTRDAGPWTAPRPGGPPHG